MIEKIPRILGVKAEEINTFNIIKQSIDARKKPDILYNYVVDIRVRQISRKKEEKLVRRLRSRDVSVQETMCCHLSGYGTTELEHSPVIIGTEPAGLLCGLMLVRQGYCPVLLERGEDVGTRTKRIAGFWRGGELHPDSDVQFGEGGVGTPSDGKLNTPVKDSLGRSRAVLQILVESGADPFTLHMSKSHTGTDMLSRIVKVTRHEVQQLGDQVCSLGRVTDFVVEEGHLKAMVVNGTERIYTRALVTVIGHNARDTFEMLRDRGVPMETKALTVGLRTQYPQTLVNMGQHVVEECRELGPASYRMTRQTLGDGGVYPFCMCPDGYVANVSSEQGRLTVDGMSYHDRAGKDANSALIVTATPEDFSHTRCSALGGAEFQRSLEEAAFRFGKGSIPIQLYGGLKEDRISVVSGRVIPAFGGEYAFTNLGEMLPSYISRSLLEAMEAFGHMIRGLDRPDAILVGTGSRTSPSVHMPRDENLESAVKGIFPYGEGAGYAGGIASAAMGGIRTAEETICRYCPFETQKLM